MKPGRWTMSDEARARLMVALATVPPLTCADCGALVSLESAVTVKRGGRALDLCAACVALDSGAVVLS
jgi:hypothetical protein